MASRVYRGTSGFVRVGGTGDSTEAEAVIAVGPWECYPADTSSPPRPPLPAAPRYGDDLTDEERAAVLRQEARDAAAERFRLFAGPAGRHEELSVPRTGHYPPPRRNARSRCR